MSASLLETLNGNAVLFFLLPGNHVMLCCRKQPFEVMSTVLAPEFTSSGPETLMSSNSATLGSPQQLTFTTLSSDGAKYTVPKPCRMQNAYSGSFFVAQKPSLRAITLADRSPARETTAIEEICRSASTTITLHEIDNCE